MEKELILLLIQSVVVPILGGILVVFWKETRKVANQAERIEQRIGIVEEAVEEMKHLSQVVMNLDKTLALLAQQMTTHKSLVDKHEKDITLLNMRYQKLRGSIREVQLNIVACQERHKT